MKEVFAFKFRPLEWAMHSRLIGEIWRGVFTEKTRFYIYQKFSLLSSDYEKLNRLLTGILENNANPSEKHDKALQFLKKNKMGLISPEFREIWLEKDTERGKFFNFNGALIPYFRKAEEMRYVFLDTFLFHVLLNEDYSAELVEKLEGYMPEGPYSYQTSDFDVSVKQNDVVIDAGAWIGDFSAYAAAKGAAAHAFEPTATTFKMLQKTAELNSHGGGGGFFL
ncbi:MAG: hypothetical protein LBH18_02100 [Spirochaetaceae bacterium]|jgi:hypothetical protein|nr:hypothetical protein [Spirochaetaceae bacterium]